MAARIDMIVIWKLAAIDPGILACKRDGLTVCVQLSTNAGPEDCIARVLLPSSEPTLLIQIPTLIYHCIQRTNKLLQSIMQIIFPSL